MTLAQKLLWFVLLLFGIAATPKLPFPIQPAAIVPSPPNTNTYGCHLVWDAVPFADGYMVFLGSSPSNLALITNVTTPGAIFQIAETNSKPWAGVRTVLANQTSDMTVITVTNYLVGRVEDLAGQAVPGTGFVLETTNTGRFLLVRGGLSNNWPKLP